MQASLNPWRALVAGAVCAALYAASAAAQEIVLYDFENFEGEAVVLTENTPDLAALGFDNDAEAVRVVSGVWELYRNAGYGVTPSRPSMVLGPGDYPSLEALGFPEDTLSAVRIVSAPQPEPPPTEPPPPEPPPPSPPDTAPPQRDPCPGPYLVLGRTGACVFECAEGTRADAAIGQCVCASGRVEIGQDQRGRRICAPPQPDRPPPGRRPADGGFERVTVCEAPYRVRDLRDPTRCRWSCAAGTHGDAASGQCVCDANFVETGLDARGRRICAPPAPAPPRLAVRVVDGADAMAEAAANGFRVHVDRNDAFDGRCDTYPDGVGTTPGALLSFSGSDDRTCTFRLFTFRELADGWRLVDYELDAARGGVGMSSRRQRTQVVIEFFSSNHLQRVWLSSITLEGPAGRDWREAFR